MQRLCTPVDGLFLAPDLEFSCSCPDWASMCKHVAAVLYGIGARLDQRPELLFQLRGVDGSDLLAQAGTAAMQTRKPTAQTRVLDMSDLGELFGTEMAAVANRRTSRRPGAKQAAKEAADARSAAPALEQTKRKRKSRA
jgi:uncharacterized Zn finger protein